MIPTALPVFSGSGYPMRLTGMLYDKTGSGNTNVAAFIPEVPISQPVDMIETKFQSLYLCVWVPAIR